jgi:ATP-binding cassette subfamily B protein
MERALHEISPHIIRGIVLLSGSLATMYFVHPLFFYGLLTWTICFMIISYFISRNIIGLAEDHATSESLLSGQLVDSISNTQNIRLFAQYTYESSYIMKALLATKQRFQAKQSFLIKFHSLQGISLTLMLAFMLYTLITLRMQGLVTIGDYALILGLSIEVGFTLWWVTEQIDYLNSAIGKCNQSLKVLLIPLEITDKEGAQPLIVMKGKITFENVKFHYKGSAPLFENLSITIPEGQKIGLVGYSGGGKTTFANLILRLFDITSGQILIDGQDIREVTQDSLRAQIGMIPQDPSLFHRTLMENIRYGRLDADDTTVIDAAKKAHAHEFITKLPQGYESLVGERGIKLSGGQRQRIALARAILKNAPILILDEATSQLDSVTENEIQDALQHLIQGKTTIVIAHRLSTLLHMDRILVFDRGNIVEDGTHQDLLAKKGLYKTLWDTQVGGFLLDDA